MAPEGPRAGPRILGLTGPIACGKTAVGDILVGLGAERIDADRVVHELMRPGTSTTAAIAAEFGKSVLLPDGGVDRAYLGRIVFGNSEALRRLEAITHPAVRRVIRERIGGRGRSGGVIVVDAVKLLQSELLALADAVWVVRCTREAEIDRLMTKRNMTRRQAEERLAAMPSFEHPRVTTVIENSGSLEDLGTRVRAAWEAFVTHDT